MNPTPAKPRTKTELVLGCISFVLLAAGFFFFFDVFWSWTHLDCDAQLAIGCWITGALISIVSLIARLGARILHWIILAIYLLMVAAFVYFLMTFKFTRMF
jgi:hypothetical protein